jgi:hypothetical protein
VIPLAPGRGIIFGRPYAEEKTFADYDAALLQVCREFGLESLPLVTQLDFGHTDPLFTIPYGIEAELDCDRQELRYIDSCVRLCLVSCSTRQLTTLTSSVYVSYCSCILSGDRVLREPPSIL